MDQRLFTRLSDARFHLEQAIEELTDYGATNDAADITPEMTDILEMDDGQRREALVVMRSLFERLDKLEQVEMRERLRGHTRWGTRGETDAA